MLGILDSLSNFSINGLLVLAGIAFIAIAILGKIGVWVDLTQTAQRLAAGVLGGILLTVGVLLPSDLSLQQSGQQIERPDTTLPASPVGCPSPEREWNWLTQERVSDNPERLDSFTSCELSMMRNWIYAKYGMPFSTRVFQEHFEQTDWYEPNKNFSLDSIPQLEQDNAVFINGYQINQGKQYP